MKPDLNNIFMSNFAFSIWSVPSTSPFPCILFLTHHITGCKQAGKFVCTYGENRKKKALLYCTLESLSCLGPTVSNEQKPSPELVINGQRFAVVG